LVECGLFVVFVIHLHVTALLVMENIRARGKSYALMKQVGQRSLAAQLMPVSGFVIFAFVVYHLLDFTFIDHHGPRSLINGVSYGLYGVVYNAFKDPLHSWLYIVAMICVGLHLTHGIQSFFQTFGFMSPRQVPQLKFVSTGLGVLVAAAYTSIPIYVLISSMK
jgi:succinate dehydrogenase / fumarate reductase cytochrome b subunit